MKTTTKREFDCVEMMHEGAAQVQRELEGKSREEQAAYWRESNESLRRRQEQAGKTQRTPAEL